MPNSFAVCRSPARMGWPQLLLFLQTVTAADVHSSVVDNMVDTTELESMQQSDLNELANAMPQQDRDIPELRMRPHVYNAGSVHVPGRGMLLIPTIEHAQAICSAGGGQNVATRACLAKDRTAAFAVYWHRLYAGWLDDSNLGANKTLRLHNLSRPLAGPNRGVRLTSQNSTIFRQQLQNACPKAVTRNMPTGSADARLVALGGGIAPQYYMLVSQYECLPALGKVSSLLYLYRLGGAAAHRDVHEESVHVRGPPICLQQAGNINGNEKNWVLFDKGGEMYASVTIQPHRVVHVPTNPWPSHEAKAPLVVTVGGGDSTVFQTSSPLLKAVQNEFGFISGGSQAVALPEGPGGRTPAYLAIVHVKKQLSYTNFAVAFSMDPPFAVSHVSRLLPLLCWPKGAVLGSDGNIIGSRGPYGIARVEHLQKNAPCVSYVTGLQLVGNRLTVSYGTGDAVSRLWSITLDEFDRTFLAQDAAPLLDELRRFYGSARRPQKGSKELVAERFVLEKEMPQRGPPPQGRHKGHQPRVADAGVGQIESTKQQPWRQQRAAASREQDIEELLRNVPDAYQHACREMLHGNAYTFATAWQDWFVFHNVFPERLGWGNGTYLDIGTNEPVGGSNTFFFDKCLGWRGVCFEPQKLYHARIKENRSCSLVPRCVTSGGRSPPVAMVMSGVGAKARLVPASDLSRSDPEAACVDASEALLPLLGKSPLIDFISIDIEGHVRCATHAGWLLHT